MRRPSLLAAVLVTPLALAACQEGTLAPLAAAPAGTKTGPTGKPLPPPADETLATICAPADPSQTTAMLAAVNEERGRQGRSPLVLSARLNEAAQAHSCDMARMGRLSVAGSNGNSVLDRVRAVDYGACGAAQNIARTGQPPAALARSWAMGKVTWDNLGDQKFDDVGIGAQSDAGGTWWTVVFGERC